MKFLCLPGAYGSAKNFGVQLGPFAKHVEDRGLANFTYTQGVHEVDPPAGWEHYFGARPVYRFIDCTSGDGGDAFEILRRKEDDEVFDTSSAQEALDSIFKTIDEDPEVDALIGYSEGAMLAASICCEEERRFEKEGIPRRIKFAIFFAGSPPLAIEDGECTAKLADECGPVIDIPTLHVFGTNDPLVYCAVALYNSCNPDTAELYDHGLGHLVPRDADNVEQLGDILQKIIKKIQKAETAGTGTPCSEYTEFSDSTDCSKSD
ncbi:hypothetical protein PG990_011866 [Apiospora arundinis]